VFDGMAGGRTYDEFFAGGAGVLGLGVVGANLSSIFLKHTASTVFMMSLLQEDYVEKELMPLKPDIIPEKDVYIVVRAVAHGMNVYATHLLNNYGGEGNSGLVDAFGTGYGTPATAEQMGTLAAIMGSNVHSVGTTIGGIVCGPFGSIVGGMIAGAMEHGVVGAGMSMVSSVTSTLSSVVSNSVVGGLVNALGITSFAGQMAISFGIGLIAAEVIGMAFGLDTSFGFGGGLVGFDALGNPVHSPSLSIMAGVSHTIGSMLGSVFGTTVMQDPATMAVQEAVNQASLDQAAYDSVHGYGYMGNLAIQTADDLAFSQDLAEQSLMDAFTSMSPASRAYYSALGNPANVGNFAQETMAGMLGFGSYAEMQAQDAMMSKSTGFTFGNYTNGVANSDGGGGGFDGAGLGGGGFGSGGANDPGGALGDSVGFA